MPQGRIGFFVSPAFFFGRAGLLPRATPRATLRRRVLSGSAVASVLRTSAPIVALPFRPLTHPAPSQQALIDAVFYKKKDKQKGGWQAQQAFISRPILPLLRQPKR